MTLLSFALGAAIGATGGVVIAPITLAQHDMGTMLGLKGFCAAILGGLGNFTGGIIAGLILGILESMGAGFVSSAYKDAIAFVILLAILFMRPQGVLKGRE
jgi:branched-chain amino acid transport system permease protein